MRLRAGPSRPGKPPHAHTRGGLRQIDFHVDTYAEAALIGPVKFPGSNFFDQPVPHIHEFGGQYLGITRRTYWNFPERSFMGYTLRKLQASGRLSRQFSYNLARTL